VVKGARPIDFIGLDEGAGFALVGFLKALFWISWSEERRQSLSDAVFRNKTPQIGDITLDITINIRLLTYLMSIYILQLVGSFTPIFTKETIMPKRVVFSFDDRSL